MYPCASHLRRRGAFTLIELLVVVGILFILMGLLSAALVKLYGTVPQAGTHHEIQRLANALVAAYSKDNYPPPSRLRLCERKSDYDLTQQLDRESYEYLTHLWPDLDWNYTNLGGWIGIDWNGNGLADGPVTLEGDQCLVFFLGGLPASNGGYRGFSANPRNPAEPGSRRDRPFSFETGRLRDLHGNGFPSYLDRHAKKPYAYFSSYRVDNGYSRYGSSDCALLNVWPYAESGGVVKRYWYPRTFQILSAGKDGVFGPGTDWSSASPFLWTPTNATAYGPPGDDDQSNFHDRPLGR